MHFHLTSDVDVILSRHFVFQFSPFRHKQMFFVSRERSPSLLQNGSGYARKLNAFLEEPMRALVASAAFLSLVTLTPANAMSVDAGIANTQSNASPVEKVARVCREFCRGPFCRTRCWWQPGPQYRGYGGHGFRGGGDYYRGGGYYDGPPQRHYGHGHFGGYY
jgi:hypothetical protein